MQFKNNIAVISTGIAHGDSHLITDTSIADAERYVRIDCKDFRYSITQYLKYNMHVFESWVSVDDIDDIDPDKVFGIIQGFQVAAERHAKHPSTDYFIVYEIGVNEPQVFTDDERGNAEAFAFVNEGNFNTEIISLQTIRNDITAALIDNGFIGTKDGIKLFCQLEATYQYSGFDPQEMEQTFEAARQAVIDVYNNGLRVLTEKYTTEYIKWLFAE